MDIVKHFVRQVGGSGTNLEKASGDKKKNIWYSKVVGMDANYITKGPIVVLEAKELPSTIDTSNQSNETMTPAKLNIYRFCVRLSHNLDFR